jgi:hypothetical protein
MLGGMAAVRRPKESVPLVRKAGRIWEPDCRHATPLLSPQPHVTAITTAIAEKVRS